MHLIQYLIAFAELNLDVQQLVHNSIGPQPCLTAFELWPEGLPFRSNIVLLVNIDVLHFLNQLADNSM